ncbi:MAG: hypothetical protein JW936_08845 [Sedimentisphaerales bacterium]|nr:hypothetical protein [Sedimentisphaerales bacterium]
MSDNGHQDRLTDLTQEFTGHFLANRSSIYVAVKNHYDGKDCITVGSKDKSAECLVRSDEIIVKEKNGRFKTQLGFNTMLVGLRGVFAE